MKVLVIGGTGHVGTYMVPGLIEAGFDVTSLSRRKRKPYQEHKAWDTVHQVTIDREIDGKSSSFAERILEFEPDVVIDMICFTLDSAQKLYEPLKAKIKQFLHCGTIWVHGYSEEVPTTEDQSKKPFGEYGIQKAAITEYLLSQSENEGTAVTVLHPGHIVGPGWCPINPLGNLNTEVFVKLAHGEELVMPNFGMETLHHVHAEDVAQAFIKAVLSPEKAKGQEFHVVSEKALTLRGYADKLARWFGKEANLSFKPFGEWKTQVSDDDALVTYDHIAHSPNCSIDRAKRLLRYKPKYSSIEAICESLKWLIDNGQIVI
ncbi:NAD-dependent epimerase/dehydratase family protein [Planctomycetota bacterium]